MDNEERFNDLENRVGCIGYVVFGLLLFMLFKMCN